MEVLLVIFCFLYFATTITGLLLLGDEISKYIRYKKYITDPSSSYVSRAKGGMSSAKKKARVALVLFFFGPFFLLFLGLRTIIRSAPQRRPSLISFRDALKDIFFKY